MGASLTLVDASQFQISSHYTININIAAVRLTPVGSHKEPAILSLWTAGYIICQYSDCFPIQVEILLYSGWFRAISMMF